MDPLVEAYQTEGRKPTSEELKRAERLTLIGLVFYVSIMSTGMLSYFIWVAYIGGVWGEFKK